MDNSIKKTPEEGGTELAEPNLEAVSGGSDKKDSVGSTLDLCPHCGMFHWFTIHEDGYATCNICGYREKYVS